MNNTNKLIRSYGSIYNEYDNKLNGYPKPYVDIDIFSLNSKIYNTFKHRNMEHPNMEYPNSTTSNINISNYDISNSNISNSNISNEVFTPNNDNMETDDCNYFNKIYIDNGSLDNLSQHSELTKLMTEKSTPDFSFFDNIILNLHKTNSFVLILLIMMTTSLLYIFIYFLYFMAVKFFNCKSNCFLYKS